MGFFTEGVHHFIIALHLVMTLNLYYFVKKKHNMVAILKEIKKSKILKSILLRNTYAVKKKQLKNTNFIMGKSSKSLEEQTFIAK